MPTVQITVVFLGLIAHGIIGGKHAALLVNAVDHRPLLIADPADIIPLTTAAKHSRTDTKTLATGLPLVPAVFDLHDKVIHVVNEVDDPNGPKFENDYKTYVPHLGFGNHDVKDDIRNGKFVIDVVARFVSKSGDADAYGFQWKEGYYGDTDDQAKATCVAKGVVMTITANDPDNTGYVTLKSGLWSVRVKSGATILISNEPKDPVMAAKHDPHHWLTY